MTTFFHPDLGEPLDATAAILAVLTDEPAPRRPSDTVPIRAAHWPTWTHGMPLTVADYEPVASTATTAIDWSTEEIERLERGVADRERARRRSA